MSLKDLNRSLYKPDSDIQQERQRKSQYNPNAFGEERVGENTAEQGEQLTSEEQAKRNKRRKLYMISGIGALVGIVVLAVIFSVIGWYQREAFNQEDVMFELTGPSAIDSGNSAVFNLTLKNNNRAPLENVSIRMAFPETFIPEENTNFQRQGLSRGVIQIGDVGSFGEKTVEFRGRFFGSKDEVAYMQAIMIYSPQNISTQFELEKRVGVRLQSSALSLDIAAPIEAASGDEIEYLVQYSNLSDQTFYNMRLQVEYPVDFIVTEQVPEPSEGNEIWYLGTIGPDQSGTIKVRGRLTGERDQVRQLHAEIGFIQGDNTFVASSSAESSTALVASPLVIRQEVVGVSDSVIQPGQELTYRLTYQNDGDTSLRDAIVVSTLEGEAYDFNNITTGGGAFSPTTRTVTWRASDIDELAQILPGEIGIIEFKIPVLQNIPVNNENDKNFTLQNITTIDSPDVPEKLGSRRVVGTDITNLSINTQLALRTELSDKESGQLLSKLTPRVGESYELRVTLALENLYNDIEEVRVSGSLPSGVNWKGSVSPSSEEVAYNSRTQEFVWTIGSLDSGTGILTPAREITFDIEFSPTADNVGKNYTLISRLEASAIDQFTEETVQFLSDDIKTLLVREEES